MDRGSGRVIWIGSFQVASTLPSLVIVDGNKTPSLNYDTTFRQHDVIFRLFFMISPNYPQCKPKKFKKNKNTQLSHSQTPFRQPDPPPTPPPFTPPPLKVVKGAPETRLRRTRRQPDRFRGVRRCGFPDAHVMCTHAHEVH